MWLADEIKITLGHEAIYLRPSLRAAFRLERRHGGFEKIVKGVADGNISIIADVVRESVERSTFVTFMSDIDALPLRLTIERISEPLIAHVMAIAGVDGSADAKPSPDAERIPFAEYHAKLFRLATGWLGWSPADAWEATAAEITEAYKGRMDMLGAVFGGGKSDPIEKPDKSVRQRLNALGDLTVTSMSQVLSCQ
jgi:hypothetical protein